VAKKKWYAGVVCGRCGAHVPWVEDPSRGKVKLVSDPGAKISLTCKACGWAATYPFEQVTSFEEGTSPRLN
jgi:RNase P subunit RPR2